MNCSHCGHCARRCQVLEDPGLDIGSIAHEFERIAALPASEQPAAISALAGEWPSLYHALRQCCFCGHCTVGCPCDVIAPAHMRAWRELFMRAHLMSPDDARLVMVDNEWHLFSAYRAIYGVTYPDAITLAAAESQPGLVDTLFFPGCSLVSYAPQVIDAVGTWLTESGIQWALSDDCCGSPLMSAGLFERAEALRTNIVERAQRAGITRIVTVCPGCAEELSANMPADIALVPLPELLEEIAAQRTAEGRTSGFSPLESASFTFFDSCHDRADERNGRAIRRLMATYVPQATHLEMQHHGADSLCCGAGGAVAGYDPQITEKRIARVMEEARATDAQTIVTACPTCAYTIAQENLAHPDRSVSSKHYLEVLFGVHIDWAAVFDRLNSMWSGEYGPWLTATFFE